MIIRPRLFTQADAGRQHIQNCTHAGIGHIHTLFAWANSPRANKAAAHNTTRAAATADECAEPAMRAADRDR